MALFRWKVNSTIILGLKDSSLRTERQYNQLKKTGIEYLEIRSIDLNPYSDIGISIEDIKFLELLSLFCSLSDSPKIDELKLC